MRWFLSIKSSLILSAVLSIIILSTSIFYVVIFFIILSTVVSLTIYNLKIISGLYYKHMTIVNDDSSAVSEQSFKLIDDARGVIYDHCMFIIQWPAMT